MPAASGKVSIKRTAKGVAQDFFDGGTAPFIVPPEGIISVMARTDAANLPRAIMVQFHVGDWNHRAVWGEEGVIPYGTPGTIEHFRAGPLPTAGNWTQLDVPAEKIGLKPGDKISGYAFTQFDGTVYWDRLAVRGIDDPAHNPARSLSAWLKSREGQDTQGVPPEINTLLKKPADPRAPGDLRKLRDYFVQNVCTTTREDLRPAHEGSESDRKRARGFRQLHPLHLRDGRQAEPARILHHGARRSTTSRAKRWSPARPPCCRRSGWKTPKRLDLARWLVDPANPLTARVTVNRFWQQFFGIGLVKTSGDFGSQGEAPSHPELLDWLAADFRDHGWDMKRLVKTIVTSATWRQCSRVDPGAAGARSGKPPARPRPALPRSNAEEIRDDALFVSGLLVEKMGGKGVQTLSAAEHLGAGRLRRQQHAQLPAGQRRRAVSPQHLHVPQTHRARRRSCAISTRRTAKSSAPAASAATRRSRRFSF